MTQDERWTAQCKAYMKFVEENKRCPSKYREDERQLHSWYKHGRKLLNADKMKAERKPDFQKVLALAEANHHLNQFA